MKTHILNLIIMIAFIAGLHHALAQPTLTITPAGNQALLSWPASATGYILQSTTNLTSQNWVTNNNSVNAINGTNEVTISSGQGNLFFRLIGAAAPAGIVLIPAGSFTMGNSINDADLTDATPTNVTMSAFYMDTNLVSYTQWQSVYNWATNNGYGFANAGAGKAPNHPVHLVDWYDCVKWCNARSEQGGLPPVYYTDAGLTQVYVDGEVTPYVDWTATGYRLPTEAEWEKAARGGLSGQRFPWGNTISESQANYYGCTTCGYSYDLGPTGPNATFATGTQPYTSPVGYFAANGYGLYDMAGNLLEWCWDWYGTPYAGGTDPHGPATGGARVMRGGNWNDGARWSRCAARFSNVPVRTDTDQGCGFRCVRGL